MGSGRHKVMMSLDKTLKRNMTYQQNNQISGQVNLVRIRSFCSDIQWFIKGINWLIFTSLFGLLQLLVIFLWTLLRNKPFPLDQILADGSILFFACAIVASVIIDYGLSSEEFKSYLGNLFVFFFALIIIFSSSLIYGLCLDAEQEISEQVLIISHQIIFFSAMSFATTLKLNYYNKLNQLKDSNSIGKLEAQSVKTLFSFEESQKNQAEGNEEKQ